jgi:hypothetical protein
MGVGGFVQDANRPLHENPRCPMSPALICIATLACTPASHEAPSVLSPGHAVLSRQDFIEIIEVCFDGAKLANAGISTFDASRAVTKFLQRHSTLTLSELKAFTIPSSKIPGVQAQRIAFPLMDLADVKFKWALPSVP